MNKHTNIELFESSPISKAILEMVIPTIIAQLVVLIYNLADTFFIGRINNPYMVAATALILPVYNLAISIAGLSGIGGGSLISRLLGVKDYEQAERVSSFSILLSIVMSGFLSVLTLIFMTPLLALLGAGPSIIKYAKQYTICVLVLGGIPTALSGTLAHILRSTGKSKQAGNGITFGALLNIALDPLFMFCLFPKGMEVIGVGIATMLSNTAVCFYYYFLINKAEDSIIHFSLHMNLPSRNNILSIFAIGFPSAASSLCYDIASITMNRLITGYGDIALAAVGLAMKAERLPLNVGTGICQGTMPLVAYNYASGNKDRMLRIIKCSVGIGLTTAVLSLATYQIFASEIIRIFIADADTISLGAHFLRIRAVATPLMFLVYFIMVMMQGVGDSRNTFVLGVVRWGVFNVLSLVLMHAIIGIDGIVWAQTASDFLTLLLSIKVSARYIQDKSTK